MIDSFFFLKLKPKKIFCPACALGELSRLASLCCFAVLAPFGAFAVCTNFVFHCFYFFSDVLRFPCVFFFACSGVVNANSVAIFVPCFLALVSVLLFCRFCAFLLSFLCLVLEFILRKFYPGALRFP